MNKDQKRENKIRLKSKLGIRSSNQKQSGVDYLGYLYLAFGSVEDEAVSDAIKWIKVERM